MLLAKGYRLKNCFKIVFDKHVLRKKTAFFLLKFFGTPNTVLKNYRAQSNNVSLGFPTQKQRPKLINEKKGSNGFFHMNFTKNTKNTSKNLEIETKF